MTVKTLCSAAATFLLAATSAQAERGADGHLNILYWQAPSTLNPYLSGGFKDLEAASLILEPLARYDQTGTMVPYLAQDIPTVANGGVAADLTSITWHLKEGLLWSDGTPVTAQDAVFTWEYCTAEGAGCAQAASFGGVQSVIAVSDTEILITFDGPRPNPYQTFVGQETPLIQAAQFADCLGAAAPTCVDENFAPIGTGPFVATDFRVNDVIQFAANQNYRDATKPAFATATLKGGGDALASARAVMETGEFDYGWNLQLPPEVIAQTAQGGHGVPVSAFGALVERIEVNLTNPSADLPEGERSTLAHPHPYLSNPDVRRALSMAIDRAALVEIGYGDSGRPTCDLVPAPAIFAAGNTSCLTQDIAGANALLDAAGFVDTNGDGVREMADGTPLTLLFQTSTNGVRQDFQAVIKSWWEQIGFDVELRHIPPAVFFGGDANSTDTFQRFYADVEMYANGFPGTDPQSYLSAYSCDRIPSPERQWQGENVNRYCDPAYQAMIDELAQTADLEARGALAQAMNNALTVDSNIIIPLVDRGRVSARANDLAGVILNTWDSELWNIADWHRSH